MTHENICKFVPFRNEEQLRTKNFVYECDNQEEMVFKESHRMCLAVSGEGIRKGELFEKKLVPGDVFFTFSGGMTGIQNVNQFKYMYITFYGHRSEELFRRFGISEAVCVFSGYQELIPFWKNCLGKANEKNLDLMSESVLMYTFSQMSAVKEESETYLIGKILKYVEEHFTERDITLSSVAEALGYHEKYISRVFKKNVGINFSEYLTNARVQHAVFLMEQGITAVKNVAFLCGYQDPLYFSNVFKKKVGVSPSVFMARKTEEK